MIFLTFTLYIMNESLCIKIKKIISNTWHKIIQQLKISLDSTWILIVFKLEYNKYIYKYMVFYYIKFGQKVFIGCNNKCQKTCIQVTFFFFFFF